MGNKSYMIKYALEQAARNEVEKAKPTKHIIQQNKEHSPQLFEEQKGERMEFLKKHTLLVDLHFLDPHNAKTKVGVLARSVANSESLFCIGFIHGKGVHSNNDDITDYQSCLYDEDYYRPILKPIVRELLDSLSQKFNCKSIYGENAFKVLRFDHSVNSLCSGVTLFMNKAYNDYFIVYKSDWDLDDIHDFFYNNDNYQRIESSTYTYNRDRVNPDWDL